MKDVYCNGTIYTGEGFVEVFIVENGKFIYSGNMEEARKLIDDSDLFFDLKGQFVCAGFNDSHMHMLNYGYSKSQAALAEHTDSLKGMMEYVGKFREDHPTKWLKGRGWNQDYFTDVNRMPTRYDIDEVISDIPVVLTRACGHCCVVNSKALEVCGIDENTVSPDGGSIGRTVGVLNGLFFDNAINLISAHQPEVTDQDIRNMLVTAERHLNAYGITSVQTDDYGVFRGRGFEDINKAYQYLERNELLTVRVNEQCNFTTLEGLQDFVDKGYHTGVGSNMFKTGPLKLLGDGSLGGRTAYLSRPYADDPSTEGFPLFSQEQFDEMIDYANKHDMHVAVHAIGDKCLDMVLDAIEKALNNHPVEDHRHGIVHCQISRQDQLERIERLNCQVYAQSVFLDYDNHIVEERAGKDLASTSYSWKTLADNGVTVSNGSDAPVEEPDVLKGIECAVTRTSLDGTGLYLPEQAFTVKEAIDSFTVNGSRASFEEDVKGKIKAGYLADFVILDKDPFQTEPEKIHEIKVMETFLGGRSVYRR